MRINVIGSGYMGKQITSLLTILGFDVLIWQKKDGNLPNLINTEIRKLEKILKIKSKGSFKIVNELQQLENFITIETVIEDLEIKRKVFDALNFKENLFSNTSSIQLSNIKKNINGFHFMNPISMKIIEVCKVAEYNETNLNILINELKKASYELIEVADTPGYIVNKILFKEISFFFHLIEVEKYNSNNINKIYIDRLKHPDPIKIVNLIGVDTCLQILINLNKFDSQYYVPKMLNDAVKKNILGYKNKKIFKIS